MNPGWSPAYERVATPAFDRQPACARLDFWQNTTHRRPHDKNTAASPLVRFLYWIYERRLLNQLKQRPMPRHVGIILDGNRRHARKRGLSDPCMSSEHFGQLAWQFKRMSGSSGLKVQAAIAC